jgi:medium-chain acyl-[acyl-carrier-protein] hydrolase
MEVPADVEVCAIQLPGRENRIRESIPEHVIELVPPLLDALYPALDVPFALFGHSLGAAVVYELAGGLLANKRLPRVMAVSGRRAPHLPRDRPPLHCLPDAEFRVAITKLGGTPQEVLAHEELMDFFLPILRADLRLAETYGPNAKILLTCPLIAFAGRDDEEAPPERVRAWRDLAGAGFALHVLEGGHFFLHEHRESILRHLLAAV